MKSWLASERRSGARFRRHAGPLGGGGNGVKITCSSCQAVFSVPDERMPPGKTVRITCLKCGNPIHARLPATEPGPGAGNSAESTTPAAVAAVIPAEDLTDQENRPFDLVEEATPAALMCLQDPELVRNLAPILADRGYHPREEADRQTACLWWEQNEYALVLTDDDPPAADPARHLLLAYARRLPMHRRRETLLCLISRSQDTMDGIRAFQMELELIVNRGDLERLPLLLDRAIAEQRSGYAVFRQVGKERGLL